MFVFTWLISTAERFTLSPEGTEGDLLYRFLAGLAQSKEQEFENELRDLWLARWTRFKYKALRRTLGEGVDSYCIDKKGSGEDVCGEQKGLTCD